MELRIPEEGKAVYVGEDEILLAYYGSEIELRFKTEPPHGDRIYSARLPILNKNLPFLHIWEKFSVSRRLLPDCRNC